MGVGAQESTLASQHKMGMKKGQTNSGSFKKGNIPWCTNKKLPSPSEETKRKMSIAHKGLLHYKDPEYRKKISLGLMGTKRPDLIIRNKSKKQRDAVGKALRGYKHTEETKKKMSLSQIGLMVMEKHWNWQDGKSFEPYSPEFNDELKEKIKKRDNHTCQECNYTKEQLKNPLNIHHIDYDKKNNNPNNLITLCVGCNTKANFNRKQWTRYYKNKVREMI